MCNFRVYDTIRDKRISLLSCKGVSRLNSTTTKSQTQKSQMEHVLMHTFRSSEPQYFSPWKETQESPPCTRDSSSIGKWISRVPRADTRPSISLRAREANQSVKSFFPFFSLFLFFKIHSNVSLINLRDITRPTKVGDWIVSWKKKKKKKKKTSRDFPIQNVSRAVRKPCPGEADGWRTDHLADTTIVRRRCY